LTRRGGAPPPSRRLEDEFWFLAYRRPVADPRHQALKTAIGWNNELLSAADARVFRELSVQARYLFTHVSREEEPDPQLIPENAELPAFSRRTLSFRHSPGER
jgi:hypothetical protein